MVGYRTRLVRRAEGAVIPPLPAGTEDRRETAPVTIGGQRMDATFVARESLPVGATLTGPAVVEEATATTLVPPGWTLTCLPAGDLLLEHR